MKIGKKLFTKLSTKHFVVSHILILVAGLAFIAGLYYILNIQYQKPKGAFVNGPVTNFPKSLLLDLDRPDQDTLSYSSSVIVSGKTSPGSTVLISTDASDLIIKSKPDGSFSTVLILNEGVNIITAAVFDSKGESRLAERTVYYSKEKL